LCGGIVITSILFVDEDPAFLKMAKQAMENGGKIEVDTTGSVEKAMERLKMKTFDVIISGCEMQDMGGIRLLKKLRSEGNDTPAILYADRCKENIIVDAIKNGAEFVLQKSDDPKPQLIELKYIIEEIVKRKNAEKALRRRENDFQAIVNKNADSMIVLDLKGVIQYANPAALDLFNMQESEMLGKMMGFPIVLREPVEMYVVRGFKEFVAAEMRMVEVGWKGEPSYLISFRDVTGHINYEEQLSKARDELEIRVQERTEDLTKANESLQKEIEDRKTIEEELRVEVEERRTVEEELRNEIEQSAKIDQALKESKSEVELYLDLMGHDINNLNQIGIGYLELAQESSDVEEVKSLIAKPLEVMRDTSQIIQNVRKLQQVTKDELKRDVNVEIVNLSRILPEIKERYIHIKDRSITINLESPQLCFVKANDLIKDVFSNLIDNAIKHSYPEKPLVVNIKLEQVKEKNQEYIRCVVEDNGPGIPDWVKSKIFLRFQRGVTKAHGKGLGLYLVRSLVKSYKGSVWVEDRIQGDYTKGVRFVVVFPLINE
jgi:signal transduction histidine kinase